MSSRSTRRGRRRTRKRELENVHERNETSENISSLNDVDMEYRDVLDKKIDMEHVKDWDKKQELIGHRGKDRMTGDATLQKTEDINSVRSNGEHSCSDNETLNSLERGVIPKAKQEMPNGKADFKNACGIEEEETSHNSHGGKRKRCLFECDNFCSKVNGLICVGILPGLNSIISSSDDSDQSCLSESELNENYKYDLLGRKIIYVAKKSPSRSENV